MALGGDFRFDFTSRQTLSLPSHPSTGGGIEIFDMLVAVDINRGLRVIKISVLYVKSAVHFMLRHRPLLCRQGSKVSDSYDKIGL